MKGSFVVIGIAWVLYAASWFIEALGTIAGWQAFLNALFDPFDTSFGGSLVIKVIYVSSALTNLLMIASPVIMLGRFDRLKRALPWLLMLATILNAQWFAFLVDNRAALRAGYYLWCASFFMVGFACFLNQRVGRATRATTE